MNKVGFTYLQEEDKLILGPLEPGEVTVPLQENVLKIFFERTREGFRLSLQTARGEKVLRVLVLKDAGPAVLRLTDEIAERIGSLKLSWNLKDLKIEGLKLGEELLELSFVSTPLNAENI
ncbi:MAG: hypothetical protein FGF52_02370 [Candidatus Brockarchaeota archaeon]|nr:hypothetical protein [Candidatus Brockarchaeota archaeon]